MLLDVVTPGATISLGLRRWSHVRGGRDHLRDRCCAIHPRWWWPAMSRTRLTIAELAILALTGLGFALSYSSLVRLAEEHGYVGWEARAWPVTIDLLALAGTLLALELAARGSGPRGEAWGLAVLAAVATLSGNILSVWPDPVSMALHSWPAICMLGAWHTLMRAAVSGEAGKAMSKAGVAQHEPARLPDRVPARSEVRRLVRRTNGAQLTPERVAERTGVSISHARRLLREERAPHVIEAER